MTPAPLLRRLFRSPAWLLALVLLAPFLPVLLHPAGRVLGNGVRSDNPDMFYFINAFAGACWRGGSIPLWNPYIMLGHPFLGEGQAAIFHPLSWFFIALPTGVAYNWIVACCFLFAGLAFYGYLRALNLSLEASFCGALTWCCSNVFISRIYGGHITNLLIFFELPLMLMFWERHRQSGSLRPLVGLSLVYALMILAAHPQFLYIFSLFFMCYVLAHSALAATEGRAAALAEGKAIARLGCFVLLGIGIGAIQLLPTADFAGQSFRTQASIDYCGTYSYPPECLSSLFLPGFFGYSLLEDAAGFYWGRGNYWEMTVYLGVLPLLLALPGFFAAPRRRRLALAACALVFFTLALGAFTPLFPLIYKYVPFFNMFRGPSKNIHAAELCLATFAAFGFESLLRPASGGAGNRRLKPALFAGAALILLALAFGAWVLPHPEAAGSHLRRLAAWTLGEKVNNFGPASFAAWAHWASTQLFRSVIFMALALGLLALAWKGKWPRAHLPLAIALILADSALAFHPLLATYDESITRAPSEMMEPLQGGAYPQRVLAPAYSPNLPMLYKFSSPSGYVGAALARYNNFINAYKGLSPDTEQVFNPVHELAAQMSFWAFDAVVFPRQMLTPGMPVAASAGDQNLVRLPRPFPRAYLAAAPRPCRDEQDALQYALATGPALQQSPAVERAPAALPPAAPLEPQEGAQITAFSPNRIELEAKAAQPRVLVLAEAYEKNWKATVNDVAAPVFPANYLFRGVIVPAGNSHVVFSYQPAAFRWGALLSLLSLSGALALGFRLRRERPRAPLAPEEAPEREAEPAPPQAPAQPAARAKKASAPARRAKR